MNVGATGVIYDVEGAKAIAAMLAENHTLIELSLHGMKYIIIARNQR